MGINWNKASAGIAVTSLFVALGGPAEAAKMITGSNIKNSSITTSDIKDSSLTGSDIKNSSLTGSDVKDGSLTAKDLAAGTLTSGSAGPAGPAGPGGTPGAKGDTGATGPTGAKGTAGDDGATGPAGQRGATGTTGNTGPAGAGRWVLIDNNGAIAKDAGGNEMQSGGFRVANAYPTNSAGTGNVYIDSGDADLSNNGIVASIALANGYSQKGSGEPGTLNNGRNPGADNNPEFSGEISATKCLIPSVVTCAPLDVSTGGTGATTNLNNYFVVSPRNSDGSYTGTTGATGTSGPTGPTLTTNTHKRFYVIITGPRD